MVDNVTTVEIRLSRAEATLDPAVKGTLASLTGLSVNQIRSDLANKAYSPYQPAPILANAPANIVQFIKLHPSEFPGVSVLDVSRRSYPLGGNVGSQVLGYVGPITGTRLRPTRARLPDRLDDRPDRYRGLLRAVPARSRRHEHHRSRLQRQRHRHASHDPTQDRRFVVLNIDAGLQSALDGILKSDILHDRTCPTRARGAAQGDQWRGGRAGRQQRGRARDVELPVLQPVVLRERTLGRPVQASARGRRVQQLRDPGSLHPGQHVQVGHGDR